ncbi:uncharacterized protein Z519_00882 [Cladophialophora bantiana CBS 173.52]|uniref:Protein kinase domain-containing protein n=1 Tax=Cladophialophora bantiana (strain ATCC 10958 / CBS 173.52 / CDC B-1940 / NIH 8579) TaxID=1442370 RepID=A0A0D2IR52_CLAB1|nr:uncharacterized protein Z519_00882 [Cladophialophora bantiana CBS 173.52]KIW99219.1 hypothetical protein Z519_00882 [Cladophialophora bantiana CBS 173.52]
MAVVDVHAEGFIHAGFTISNPVIDKDGDAKIIDFQQTGMPRGVGTKEPPEVVDRPTWRPNMLL